MQPKKTTFIDVIQYLGWHGSLALLLLGGIGINHAKVQIFGDIGWWFNLAAKDVASGQSGQQLGLEVRPQARNLTEQEIRGIVSDQFTE